MHVMCQHAYNMRKLMAYFSTYLLAGQLPELPRQGWQPVRPMPPVSPAAVSPGW